jgi:hypothetical protein
MYRNNKKDNSLGIFNTHESNGTTGLSDNSMFQSPTKKGNGNLEIPAIGNRVSHLYLKTYIE